MTCDQFLSRTSNKNEFVDEGPVPVSVVNGGCIATPQSCRYQQARAPKTGDTAHLEIKSVHKRWRRCARRAVAREGKVDSN